MPIGQCPLCRNHASLQSSHFLPRGLYKLLRDPTDPKHVVLGRTRTERTTKQVKAFLLCRACEDRFDKFGEGWVLSHGVRPNGEFRLQTLLKDSCAGTRLVDDSVMFRASSVPGLRIDRLVYFAASIYWRAAVFDWSDQFDGCTPLDYGPYTEAMRLFLLERAAFPYNGVLYIAVSTQDRPLTAMSTPFGGRSTDGSFFAYHLHIPGIRFILLLGQRIPHGLRNLCSVNSPDRPIFLSPLIDEKVQDDTLAVMQRIVEAGGELD